MLFQFHMGFVSRELPGHGTRVRGVMLVSISGVHIHPYHVLCLPAPPAARAGHAPWARAVSRAAACACMCGHVWPMHAPTLTAMPSPAGRPDVLDVGSNPHCRPRCSVAHPTSPFPSSLRTPTSSSCCRQISMSSCFRGLLAVPRPSRPRGPTAHNPTFSSPHTPAPLRCAPQCSALML